MNASHLVFNCEVKGEDVEQYGFKRQDIAGVASRTDPRDRGFSGYLASVRFRGRFRIPNVASFPAQALIQ